VLVQRTQDVFNGGFDLFVAGRAATAWRHGTHTLDGILYHGFHAGFYVGIPVGLVTNFWCTGHACRVTGEADRIVKLLPGRIQLGCFFAGCLCTVFFTIVGCRIVLVGGGFVSVFLAIVAGGLIGTVVSAVGGLVLCVCCLGIGFVRLVSFISIVGFVSFCSFCSGGIVGVVRGSGAVAVIGGFIE